MSAEQIVISITSDDDGTCGACALYTVTGCVLGLDHEEWYATRGEKCLAAARTLREEREAAALTKQALAWAQEANGSLDQECADLQDEWMKERKQLEREREAMQRVIEAGRNLRTVRGPVPGEAGVFRMMVDSAWDAAVAQYEAARSKA